MINSKQISSAAKACILFFLVTGLSGIQSAFAQPTTPTTPNQTFYSSTARIKGFNDCMFAYTTTSLTTNTIVASAYYAGNPTPTIYVRDLTLGLNASVACTGSMASVPDLVICNYWFPNTTCTSCAAVNTDFILAVTYINTGGNIEIDYYDIWDNGFSMTVNSFGSPTIISGYQPATVHIDLMADYMNGSSIYSAGTWQIPVVCDNFAITWDDFSCSVPVIYTSRGNINNLSLTTPVPIGFGSAPDVAAVQNTAGDMRGLITYVGVGGNSLYLSDYNFNTSVCTTSVLDNGGSSGGINLPRIDAIDDFANNSSTTNTNYKVVAQVSVSGNTEIRNYDNLTYPSYYSFSSTVNLIPPTTTSPPYRHSAPTVAVAGSTYDYNVFHATTYGGASTDLTLLEPMSLTSPSTLSPGTYYWVNGNSSPQSINMSICSFANSVCAAENDITQPVMYAWAYKNGPTFDVDYKNPTTTYAFKPSHAGADKWQVFPNPTSTQLSVVVPQNGTDVVTYEIMDITGKQLLRGGLQQSKSTIDVSKLAPGTYSVKMYKNGVPDGQSLFVKK